MTQQTCARFFCLISMVLACLWGLPAAWACSICAPAAETTLVNRLSVAAQVVLARPLATSGEFVAVVAVKGAPVAAGQPPLRGVVDDRLALRVPATSSANRQPAQESLALLTYSALTQRWLHIGDIPRDRSQWLQKLASFAPAAQLVAADWSARLQFLVPDLQHPNLLVAQTAFEEVASAPYAVMRHAFRAPGPGIKPTPLQQAAPRSTQLLGWLQDAELAPRHSLYYLLLGVSGDIRSVDFLTANLTRVAAGPADSNARQPAGTERPGSAYTSADISAMLAALVEIRGAGVLPWIEQTFLTHTVPLAANASPQAQRQAMSLAQAAILALGVHGAVGDSGPNPAYGLPAPQPAVTLAQVVQVYAHYIRRHPAMAGLVASDLANWGQWQFAESFALALQNEAAIPFASRYAMVFYLLRNPRPEAKAWVDKLRQSKVI